MRLGHLDIGAGIEIEHHGDEAPPLDLMEILRVETEPRSCERTIGIEIARQR